MLFLLLLIIKISFLLLLVWYLITIILAMIFIVMPGIFKVGFYLRNRNMLNGAKHPWTDPILRVSRNKANNLLSRLNNGTRKCKDFTGSEYLHYLGDAVTMNLVYSYLFSKKTAKVDFAENQIRLFFTNFTKYLGVLAQQYNYDSINAMVSTWQANNSLQSEKIDFVRSYVETVMGIPLKDMYYLEYIDVIERCYCYAMTKLLPEVHADRYVSDADLTNSLHIAEILENFNASIPTNRPRLKLLERIIS